MKKQILNFSLFVCLCTALFGLLWTTTSCGGGGTIENPTGSELGAVRVTIDLNTFNSTAPMPGAFGPSGSCFARHQAFNGTSNILCNTTSSKPLPLVLNKNIINQGRDESFLQIQVIGANQFFQEFFYANSDISVDGSGKCTVLIAAPIDQSSTIKVRFVDVCCSFNSRRIEWTSQMGDQNLSLSSSVPKTQTQVNNGATIDTRKATLVPFGVLSCQ